QLAEGEIGRAVRVVGLDLEDRLHLGPQLLGQPPGLEAAAALGVLPPRGAEPEVSFDAAGGAEDGALAVVHRPLEALLPLLGRARLRDLVPRPRPPPPHPLT